MTDASLILELSVEPPAPTAPTTASEPAVSTSPPSLVDAAATVTHAPVVVAVPAAKDLPAVELKKRKFAHTSDAQRRCMLEWLEVPGNFQLLASPAGCTTASAGGSGGVVLKNAKGKKLKKTDGFRALTHYVNAHTQSNWTMEITKSRFESFMTTFRKVKAQAATPDFVVTDNDRSRGITDVRQKLNALCVYYDRIEAFFHPQGGSGEMSETAEPQADGVAVVESAETVAAVGEGPEAEDASAGVEAVDAEGDDNDRRRKRLKADDAPQTTEDEVPVDETTKATANTDDETAAAQPVVPADVMLKQLAMERERLDLLQKQLEVRKRELDLREQELKLQEEKRKRDLYTEIAAKLIEAGKIKSVTEIKEILEVITGVTQTTDTTTGTATTSEA